MSVGLGWGLIVCISNKLPDDAHSADRNGLDDARMNRKGFENSMEVSFWKEASVEEFLLGHSSLWKNRSPHKDARHREGQGEVERGGRN